MRRLLIDVTRTLQSGQHTGIQRVVRRLWHALQQAGDAHEVEVRAVVFEGEEWQALAELPRHPLEMADAASLPGRAPCPALGARMVIKPQAGDVILMADASWYIDPWPAVDAALGMGAKLVGLVHDLLPLQKPQWFRPELQPRFVWHLERLVERASLLITPSEVVRHALQMRLTEPVTSGYRNLPVACQPLGADFLIDDLGTVGSIPAPLANERPFALMVGTIEPRKNHRLVLAAFEQLWAQGEPLQLVLVGAPGWCSDAVLEQIRAHAELGGRLHWFSHLQDAQLHALYKQARTLVFASLDEGFGLPIAEAAYLGCPVLAADLPVLREAGGDWPTYLQTDKVENWIRALSGPQPASLAAPQVRCWAEVGWQLLVTLRQLRSGASAALPVAGGRVMAAPVCEII